MRAALASLFAAATTACVPNLAGGRCLSDDHCPRGAGLVCAAAGASQCRCISQQATGLQRCDLGDVEPDAGDGDGGCPGCALEVDGGELTPSFRWDRHDYTVLPFAHGAVDFVARVPGARLATDAADASVTDVAQWTVAVPTRLAAAPTRLSVLAADGGPALEYRFSVMPLHTTGWFETASSASLGASVAASGDALVLGAPTDLGGRGAALFDLGTGRLSSLILGATGDDAGADARLGFSVAVAGDVAAAGAPYFADGGRVALARLLPDGGVAPEAELPAPHAGGRFGAAVAVAGGLVACGDGSSAVVVYGRDADGGWAPRWELDGGEVGFGSALALSSGHLVAGAVPPLTEKFNGARPVIPFVRSDAGWTREGPLRAEDGGRLGVWSTVLALDGDTLAVGDGTTDVGEASELRGAGAVFVYRRLDGGWQLETTLTASPPRAGEAFGTAVALEGGLLAVGVPLHQASAQSPASGAVVVLSRDGGWQPSLLLKPPVWLGNARFGESVALSRSVLAVGASGYSGGKGCVLKYRRTP